SWLLRTGQWQALMDELHDLRALTGTSLARGMLGEALMPLLGQGWRAWRRRGMFGAATALIAGSKGSAQSGPAPPWMAPEFVQRVGVEELARHSEVNTPMPELSRAERYKLVFEPMHMRGAAWSTRTQARFGIGFADPWSDVRLVRFVLAIPQMVINRPGDFSKPLVREAMRGIMPESVRRNSDKIEPTAFYQREMVGSARPTVEFLLTGMRASALGYVDESRLQAHYAGIVRGEPEHPCLWQALSLEMWLRRHWS
ncbi:MAG: asparagine synthase (glutamine-hydrolyzing), partial [Gammaproteobacteria bacterium]